MEWFRAHPYASTLAGAVALIVFGVLFVNSRAVAPVTNGPLAWGGAGALLNPSYQDASNIEQPTVLPVTAQPPYEYTLPNLTPASDAAGGTSDVPPADSFNYDAFIALLTKSAAGTPVSTAGGNANMNAYAFIPGGIVSTSTPQRRTTLQKALYDYGNNVGSLIQSFEQDNPNTTQTLTNFLNDRTDPQKSAAVAALVGSLGDLGGAILAIDSTPSQVSDANQALGESYQTLSARLALVPKAQGDQALLQAADSYDTSVDAFVKNYVSLAQIFAASGVSFSPADPGSVFTFSPTNSF